MSPIQYAPYSVSKKPVLFQAPCVAAVSLLCHPIRTAKDRAFYRRHWIDPLRFRV